MCDPCGGRGLEKVLEPLDEAYMDLHGAQPACVAHRDEPPDAHFYAPRTPSAPHGHAHEAGLQARFSAGHSPGVELLSVRKRADVVIPDIVPHFDCAHALLRHGGLLNEDVV